MDEVTRGQRYPEAVHSGPSRADAKLHLGRGCDLSMLSGSGGAAGEDSGFEGDGAAPGDWL